MPIYKYVTAERIDILRHARIRFTQPSAFNDPFECFPYFEAIASQKYINDFLRSGFCNENELEKMLAESWARETRKYPGINLPFDNVKGPLKTAMHNAQPFINDIFKSLMTMQSPLAREITLGAVKNAMNNEIGILCLSEKKDDLLMWAHYAMNHTGFVIEFDEAHLFFNQKADTNEIRGKLKQVVYSLDRPRVIFQTIEENREKWIEDIFWVKSRHWEYEREWRIICSLRDCQRRINMAPHEIYLFPIPKSSIKGVILGCRISDEDKKAIVGLIGGDSDYSHIRLSQASMDEREYRLKFEALLSYND